MSAVVRPGDAPPPPAASVRTIGCLMLNGVGDIVCVTPALEALHDRYPDARITAMVRPHLRGLVEGLPAVADVVAFGSGGLGARLAFLREIRRRRFDLWVDFHTPTFNTVHSNTRHFLRNLLLVKWSGARWRRAYASPPLAAALTHPRPLPTQDELRNANVAELTLGLAWPERPGAYAKRFPLSAADEAWAARALEGLPRPLVGLYFGTRQPAKSWPEASSTELARRLLARDPALRLVLLGDGTDVERAARLSAALPEAERPRLADFTGRTTFGQTAALMRRLDALVSSDSGPMHIADAVDVPMVALFSSHNFPAVWAPRGKRAIVIHHDIECGPCWKPACPIGNRCMANITPDEVYAAVDRMLGG